MESSDENSDDSHKSAAPESKSVIDVNLSGECVDESHTNGFVPSSNQNDNTNEYSNSDNSSPAIHDVSNTNSSPSYYDSTPIMSSGSLPTYTYLTKAPSERSSSSYIGGPLSNMIDHKKNFLD